MKKYIFRKYEANYKKLFSTEKRKLRKALGAKAMIEHVGSTAVSGLGGKGIVDILLVAPRNEITKTSKRLQKLGYEFRVMASTRKRLFFRRDYKTSDSTRRVHIHLTFIGSRDQKEMLAFRDYLILHSKTAKEYSELKKNAVKFAKGEGELYRKHKEKFILDITKKALKNHQK